MLYPTPASVSGRARGERPEAASGRRRGCVTARLARGEDLQDIAAYLRIRPAFLAALEAGDVAATPGRPYAIGFLRSYGDHLGLDGKQLAASLKPAVEAATPARPTIHREPVGESHRPPSRCWPPRCCSSARSMPATTSSRSIVVSRPSWWRRPRRPAAQYCRRRYRRRRSPSREPRCRWRWRIRSRLRPPSTSAAPWRPRAARASTPCRPCSRRSTPRLRCRLRPRPFRPGSCWLARDSSWVQVRSADRAFVRTRTLEPGDRFAMPDRNDLALSTGNAGGLEILLDGQSVGLAGRAGRPWSRTCHWRRTRSRQRLGHALRLAVPAPRHGHIAAASRASWIRIGHGGIDGAAAAPHPRRARRQGHGGRRRAGRRPVDDQHRHRRRHRHHRAR